MVENPLGNDTGSSDQRSEDPLNKIKELHGQELAEYIVAHANVINNPLYLAQAQDFLATHTYNTTADAEYIAAHGRRRGRR